MTRDSVKNHTRNFVVLFSLACVRIQRPIELPRWGTPISSPSPSICLCSMAALYKAFFALYNAAIKQRRRGGRSQDMRAPSRQLDQVSFRRLDPGRWRIAERRRRLPNVTDAADSPRPLSSDAATTESGRSMSSGAPTTTPAATVVTLRQRRRQ